MKQFYINSWIKTRVSCGKVIRIGEFDCESFARRTFTTPKIWIVPNPKFGHLPPQKTVHLPGGQLPPPIFFFFFWRTFLAFLDLQLMEDIKDGKEEVLDEVVMEHIK